MTFNYHTRKITKRKKNISNNLNMNETLYRNSLSCPRNYFILETDDRG